MTERYVRPSVTTSLTREIKIHECTALIDATFLPFVFFFPFPFFSSFRFVSIRQFTKNSIRQVWKENGRNSLTQKVKSGMVSSRFGIWLK